MIKIIITILLLPPMMMVASQEPRKKYTREQLYALNPMKKNKLQKPRFLEVPKTPHNSPQIKPATLPKDIDNIVITFKE